MTTTAREGMEGLSPHDYHFVDDCLAHGYGWAKKTLSDGHIYYELTPPTGWWRRLVNWLVWR